MSYTKGIRKLPEAELVDGLKAHIHQGPDSQMLLVEATRDVTMPEHTHAEEWGYTMEGEFSVTLDGKTTVHKAGSEHTIPADVPHVVAFKKGTRTVHFFAEPSNFAAREATTAQAPA